MPRKSQRQSRPQVRIIMLVAKLTFAFVFSLVMLGKVEGCSWWKGQNACSEVFSWAPVSGDPPTLIVHNGYGQCQGAGSCTVSWCKSIWASCSYRDTWKVSRPSTQGAVVAWMRSETAGEFRSKFSDCGRDESCLRDPSTIILAFICHQESQMALDWRSLH